MNTPPAPLARRCAVGMLLALGGAAALAQSEQQAPAQELAQLPSAAPNPDPLEPLNRSVWHFNQALDKAVLRPLAEGYRAVLPQPVRTGVANVLGNVGDVWSAVNQLLQGKVTQAALMTLRVGTNTVFGLGGLLDPATELDLPRESEDFGQTLGRWGLPAGPYLVLPVLGPSSVRDASAMPLDRAAWASTWVKPASHAWGVAGVEVLNARARLLGVDDVLAGASLDEYLFLRDGYLARRRNLVWDGDPPREAQDDEAWDAEAAVDSAAGSPAPVEPAASAASVSAVSDDATVAPDASASATDASTPAAAASAASVPAVAPNPAPSSAASIAASAPINSASAPKAFEYAPTGVDSVPSDPAASAAAVPGEPNPLPVR